MIILSRPAVASDLTPYGVSNSTLTKREMAAACGLSAAVGVGVRLEGLDGVVPWMAPADFRRFDRTAWSGGVYRRVGHLTQPVGPEGVGELLLAMLGRLFRSTGLDSLVRR